MWSISLTIITLSVIIITGSYNSTQNILVFFGLFELVFVFLMLASTPDGGEVVDGMLSTEDVGKSQWWFLAAANIGAVVMPWMIFFQQSSVVDAEKERYERGRHLDERVLAKSNLSPHCQIGYRQGTIRATAIASPKRKQRGNPTRPNPDVLSNLSPHGRTELR